MARFLRNNGLTIVLLLMFLASIMGQWLSGWQLDNQELARHGEQALSLSQYTVDPAFISSVFENWESEFLQMGVFVVLTSLLIQRGSAVSNNPDDPPRDSNLAGRAKARGAPSILRAGRAARWLYAHSLGIALFLLFAASFVMHWQFSARSAAEEAISHGQVPLSPLHYLTSAQLWFESFQNWQSEFLSTAVLIVLSIYLRQADSPESKAVAAPNDQTGE